MWAPGCGCGPDLCLLPLRDSPLHQTPGVAAVTRPSSPPSTALRPSPGPTAPPPRHAWAWDKERCSFLPKTGKKLRRGSAKRPRDARGAGTSAVSGDGDWEEARESLGGRTPNQSGCGAGLCSNQKDCVLSKRPGRGGGALRGRGGTGSGEGEGKGREGGGDAAVEAAQCPATDRPLLFPFPSLPFPLSLPLSGSGVCHTGPALPALRWVGRQVCAPRLSAHSPCGKSREGTGGGGGGRARRQPEEVAVGSQIRRRPGGRSSRIPGAHSLAQDGSRRGPTPDRPAGQRLNCRSPSSCGRPYRGGHRPITSSLPAGPRVLRTPCSAPRRNRAGQAGRGSGADWRAAAAGEGAPRGAMAGSEAS
nr:uncharacterized protein LOC116154962 [Camelus dromedarius]